MNGFLQRLRSISLFKRRSDDILTSFFKTFTSSSSSSSVPSVSAVDAVQSAASVDSVDSTISPKFTRKSHRTGAMGVKKGMMSYWDTWGVRHPVTILHLDHVQALDTFKNGDSLIQNVGIGHRSPRQTHSTQLKYFNNCGVAPKLRVRGFSISKDAVVPTGSFIYASHFLPGQLIDVTGTSIGKGFQGAMKRWGFHGQPASHGVSLAHRAIGATGGRSDPGRVFKGKKMAGHMGAERVTVRKLRIMKIDTALNCLWVKGAIPGHDNSVISIVDSNCDENRAMFKKTPPPFPTLMNIKHKLPRELNSEPIKSFDPLYKKTELNKSK